MSDLEMKAARRDNSAMDLPDNLDDGNLGVPEMYQDQNGLDVMYDATTHNQRKQAKTETNIVSVLWHELISPLTIIKGYAATLLQLNDAVSEDQRQQYLKGIDTASNRLIRLLENLRDVTSLEETNALALQRISMSDLIQQIVSEMQNQTTKHVFRILSGPRLPLVKADPEKIEMVINNLLANAIKYSPDGGNIEVSFRAVRSDDELRKIYGDTPMVQTPCIVVSIADSGVGIPPDELDRIFEKFYRIKNKLTHSTPGAGLGLYICRIIVEAHGGNIWARNKRPSGSTFYLSLPLE
jgi:signal transduction histidine kinase